MSDRCIANGLLLLFSAALVAAQEPRCGPHELTASLPLADPAYSDAMILRQDLTGNGFEVQCVLRSKLGGLFVTSNDNQSAATLFRTDHGDFEVLILPKPFVFDLLTANEHKNGKSYSYSFSGDPTCKTPIEGIRQYFVKRGNKMFLTHDAALAAILTDVPMR